MSLSQLNRNIVGGWVLLAGAVFFACLFLAYFYNVTLAMRAINWFATEAEVLQSDARVGCGRGSSYYPLVVYRYTYLGVSYEGKRIAFGNTGCGSEMSARQIASQFPPGKIVSVWVNPIEPFDSSLIVGKVLIDTWLGLALFFVGAVGSYFSGTNLLRGERATRTPVSKAVL